MGKIDHETTSPQEHSYSDYWGPYPRSGGSGDSLPNREQPQGSPPQRGGGVEADDASARDPGGPTVTRQLAAKMLDAAAELGEANGGPLDKAGNKLDRCGDNGRRCGSSVCARCAGRKARKFRRRVEATMAERAMVAPHGYAMLTMTVAANSMESGYGALVKLMAALRRRKSFRENIAGGELHVQVEPARPGAAAPWNAHAHAIVELAVPRRRVDVAGLQEAWRQLLVRRDLVGQLDLRRRVNLAADHFKLTDRARV